MIPPPKHLHELLTQDQEPFHLHDYISDRRCQLNKPSPSPNPRPKPTLHLKKHKPITNFCNHACFFSFNDSPDVRKSPLFQFQSPGKSPNKVFLHIPARTAAMLLDAAIRIQKQSVKSPKPETKNSGFGLFGSLLKRLKDRSNSKSKKSEIVVNLVPANTSRALSTQVPTRVELDNTRTSAYEIGLGSCSCNNSRLSSAGWSETNEEKSLDLETSCSSRSEEDMEEEVEEGEDGQFGSCDKCFCASPLSPFRFTLLQSPSPGRRTPDFLSPATSPSRHYNEEKEKYEAEILEKENVGNEEEKEQCSPVSVLDPPFEDDNEEEQEGEHEDEDYDDDYDQECSYANVQRTKNQLLAKLRRFERLADLDPVELEKRMLEDENDEDLIEEETSDYEIESNSRFEDTSNELLSEIFDKSTLLNKSKIPAHMKRLVFDLVSEENYNGADSEGVMKRVCKRLDSWKEVESNTIDMMVEKDFGRDVVGWKGYDGDQIKESGTEIAVAIFGLLVDELAEELISLVGGH